jgi:hypothetical protein
VKRLSDLCSSALAASQLTIDVAVNQLTGMYRIDRIVIVDRGILEERCGTREHPANNRVFLRRIL